jgi:hypothetical protein
MDQKRPCSLPQDWPKLAHGRSDRAKDARQGWVVSSAREPTRPDASPTDASGWSSSGGSRAGRLLESIATQGHAA